MVFYVSGCPRRSAQRARRFRVVHEVVHRGVTNRLPYMGRSPINVNRTEPVVEIKPKFLASIKSTNYLLNALVLREAEEKGAQCGIWLDEESNVTEGNYLNVGYVSNEGEVLLPPFESILQGCTALRLLHLVPELVKENVMPGLKGIRFAKIQVTEAKKVAEMLQLGSFVAILPVVLWDVKPIGNGTCRPSISSLRTSFLNV